MAKISRQLRPENQLSRVHRHGLYKLAGRRGAENKIVTTADGELGLTRSSGKQKAYMSGHTRCIRPLELPAGRRGFWMGFGDHLHQCLTRVQNNLGLISEQPVGHPEGLSVRAMKVVKPCCPTRRPLAAENYYRRPVSANLVKATKGRKDVRGVRLQRRRSQRRV